MSYGNETEVKLEVRDLRAARRQLSQLGFKTLRRRHFESNILYDFPELSLWKVRCLLRLRGTDGQWLLTFKGAPRASRQYKIRREIETRVDDGAQLRQILEALGLRPAFRYEKYRTEFAQTPRRGARGQPLVVLDETPIGNYLELEGPRRWIDRIAARLGYCREEFITLSYATLYREKCRQRGVKPTNMVFKDSKS